MQNKDLRTRVRRILKNKEYIRTTDNENITKNEIEEESKILLTSLEREVLIQRYIMGFSWVHVSMNMSYSESEVKRIESKAVDKISRVINDLYAPRLYAYIRSGKVFMLHSDEIKARMEKTEQNWKQNTLEEKKKVIINYLENVTKENKDKKQKAHIKKQLDIIQKLQGEKLEYFLDVEHRLIMIDVDVNVYQKQLVDEGYDEEYKNGTCADYEQEMKPYEEMNIDEKAEFLYRCALIDFIEEQDMDFLNVDKNSLDYYKETPMYIMVQLKRKSGNELRDYIIELEKTEIWAEMQLNNMERNILDAFMML